MIVEKPQTGISVHSNRSLVVSAKKLFGILFAIIILSSTYDKSGIIIGIGSRTIAVSIYKILFVGLIALFLTDCALRPIKHKSVINKRLYQILVVFFVVQTAASLLGEFFAPGRLALSSEVYYLIQRMNFLFIPLIAWRYDISPKSVLRLFAIAIIVHYLFIILQFISPQFYMSFVERVADVVPSAGMSELEYITTSTRPDNAFLWDRQSLVFYGLQRTGNYGAFAGAFGLLLLGFAPRSLPNKVIKLIFVLVSIIVVLISGSRSVLIMALVALFLFSYRTKILSRKSSILLISVFFLILTGIWLVGSLRVENFSSIYAFFDPNRLGSNLGKLRIAAYGWQLFIQSPLVGWGQRSFSAISEFLGNLNFSTSQTHSYVLSTVLSSGLIGFATYLVVFAGIVRALWRRKEKDYVIVCSLFIGLGIYNIIYDAGGLDVFACFNGIAAYYALQSKNPDTIKPSKPSIEPSQRKLL